MYICHIKPYFACWLLRPTVIVVCGIHIIGKGSQISQMADNKEGMPDVQPTVLMKVRENETASYVDVRVWLVGELRHKDGNT